jgi:hypothetical protein
MNPTTYLQAWAVLEQAFHQAAPEVELDQLDPQLDLLDQAGLDDRDLDSILEIVEDELGVRMNRSGVEEFPTLDGLLAVLSSRLGSDR